MSLVVFFFFFFYFFLFYFFVGVGTVVAFRISLSAKGVFACNAPKSFFFHCVRGDNKG